nr:hypothetical protein [uncultured Cetobacterium sp.]
MLINMLYRHNRPVVVQSPVVMDSRMEEIGRASCRERVYVLV